METSKRVPTTAQDADGPSTTSNEQHLRALEEIRAQVGDMFQRDAEFSSSPPYLVLVLDWPLHNQPAFMAERSNQVALAFSPQWLDQFIRSGDGGHVEMLAQVRAAISARMRAFKEGKDLSIENQASADSFHIWLR
jgi:hypothetical protein